MSKTITDEKGLSVVKRQATIATQQATELVVKTDEDYENASKLLGKIKTVQKLAKQEKDKVLKPLLEATRAERARWEPLETDAANAEQIVKQKMVVFVNKREQAAREKEIKIQQDLESGKIDMEKASVKMDKVVQAPTTVGFSQVRKQRVVHVVNEQEIPDNYWVVDMVQVRKDALAGVVISGVEVREENSIAGSTR